jgi:hypothetical protein
MIVRFIRDYEDDPDLSFRHPFKERLFLLVLFGAMWLTVPLFPGLAVKMVTQ